VDDGSRWLVSSNAVASPSSPWLVTADDAVGGTVGAHGSDGKASDVKDADVV
jgi:hypothetical protein